MTWWLIDLRSHLSDTDAPTAGAFTGTWPRKHYVNVIVEQYKANISISQILRMYSGLGITLRRTHSQPVKQQ